MRAELWASTMMVRSIATPLVFGLTRNSVMPLRSLSAPEVRAATTITSATWPSTTKPLAPLRRKPLPERSALSLIVCGRCFGALVDRERAEQRALGDLRQMLRLLRLAAGARDRRRGQHGGRKERRRQQRVADLLGNDAGLDVAEARAAEFLRHQQAAEAHLGKGLPHLGRIAARVLSSRSLRKCAIGALSVMRLRALSRSRVCSSFRTRAMTNRYSFNWMNSQNRAGARKITCPAG